MFKAKTERIQKLADKYPQRIQELERVIDRRTNVYIDFANVRPWATKLGRLTTDYKLTQPQAYLLMGVEVRHKIVTYFGSVATLMPKKRLPRR